MNEHLKPGFESKEDLEVLNVIEIAKAQKTLATCVENFLSVVANFVKYPDEDFANLLANYAKLLVLANRNVKDRVSRIGTAKSEQIDLPEGVETADSAGDVALKA